MAFTHVQGTGIAASSSGLTEAKAFVSNVTIGNLIVITATGLQVGAGPTLSVSDSPQTNTYIQDVSHTNTYGSESANVAIFHTLASATGALTVTITASSSSFISLSIDEYSFVGASPNVGSTSVGVGSSSTPTCGGLAISGTSLVVASYDIHTTGLTYTAGSGFTLGFTNNTTATEPIVSQYNVSVISPVAPSITLSSSSAWNAVAVAFEDILSVFDIDSSFGVEAYLSQNTLTMSDVNINDIGYVSENQLKYLFDSSSIGGTVGATSAEVTMIFGSPPPIISSDMTSGINQQFLLLTCFSSELPLSLDQYFVFNSLSGVTRSLGQDYSQLSIISHKDCASELDPYLINVYSSEYSISADLQSRFNSLYSAESAFAFDRSYISSLMYDKDRSLAQDHSQLKLISHRDCISYSDASEGIILSDDPISYQDNLIKSLLLYESPSSSDVYSLLNLIISVELSETIVGSFFGSSSELFSSYIFSNYVFPPYIFLTGASGEFSEIIFPSVLEAFMVISIPASFDDQAMSQSCEFTEFIASDIAYEPEAYFLSNMMILVDQGITVA